MCTVLAVYEPTEYHLNKFFSVVLPKVEMMENPEKVEKMKHPEEGLEDVTTPTVESVMAIMSPSTLCRSLYKKAGLRVEI